MVNSATLGNMTLINIIGVEFYVEEVKNIGFWGMTCLPSIVYRVT